MISLNRSAQWIFAFPNWQILQLIHLHSSSPIQLFKLGHVFFQQLEISDVEIVIQMVCFLRLGDHTHSPADLVVEDDLRDGFGIFGGNFFEGWLSHIVDLIAKRLFLVLAAPHQRAVSYHSHLELFAEGMHVLLDEIRMGLHLVNHRRVFYERIQIKKCLHCKIGNS